MNMIEFCPPRSSNLANLSCHFEDYNNNLKFPLKIKIMTQCPRKLRLNLQNKILIKNQTGAKSGTCRM